MYEFCFDLNLPIYPIKDNASIDSLPGENIWNFLSVKDYINPKLIEFFNSRGLSLNIAALHIRGPGKLGSIHVDGKTADSDKTKINWSFNDQHSMNWYRVKQDVIDPSLKMFTQKDRAYLQYDPEEVELIHSQKVGFPSLIQVGIPHSISNLTSTRKCISILLRDKKTQSHIPMQTAKKIFKDIIVN